MLLVACLPSKQDESVRVRYSAHWGYGVNGSTIALQAIGEGSTPSFSTFAGEA